MKTLISRILASASNAMWNEEPNLGDYTAATSEYELNLAFHYGCRLRRWFPFLNCDFDVRKIHFDGKRPDTVIHARGGNAANLLVVEIKRANDIEGGRDDIQKIQDYWFQPPYSYRFGASVVFNEEAHSTKVCVLSRNKSEALNEYQPSESFPLIGIPTQTTKLQECSSLVSTLLKAEWAYDFASVPKLQAELDARLIDLYE